jgi:hypothetical protein
MFATVTTMSCNNKQYPVTRTTQWPNPMATNITTMTFFELLMVLCTGQLLCDFNAKHHQSVNDLNHINYTASGQIHGKQDLNRNAILVKLLPFYKRTHTQDLQKTSSYDAHFTEQVGIAVLT